jgi:outer membrane autotransporter protein
MVGYDNWISPGVRVGVAGGYANTRIDGEGDTTQNHTDIDSYLIQAYGAVKGSGWYATGRTGFTWHDYDTARVMSEPLEDAAKGSHNGDQFNASIEFGAPMAHSGTIITPVASLTYSRLHQNGYSETSDGAMALAVGSQTNDSIVSGLGLKGLVPIANDTVIEGRALWLHEFGDNAQIVNASFAAGGGTFTAAGPGVGRDSADLGIGMLAQIGFNSTFEINYDANIRDDYLAHVGSARIDVHF